MSTHLDADHSDEVDEAVLLRFREVLSKLPSLQAAADLTGNSTQQIAKWRDGKARLPFRQAAILTQQAGFSLDWLAHGGYTPKSEPPPPVDRADYGEDNVDFIPLLDVVVSAGPGFLNPSPYEIERLPFPTTWLTRLGLPSRFARFCDSRGDSMEPTIPDGAVCLVDIRFEHARKDGIYVVIDGNNVRIKRIAMGWAGALTLISDNERYATETLAAPDAEALRIAGKVVWFGGEI